MGFNATLVSKEPQPGGTVRETYTWVLDSGSTTGNITADSTLQPEIVKIDSFGVSSNGDSAALVAARDAGANVLKITSAADDSGTAFIEGRAA